MARIIPDPRHLYYIFVLYQGGALRSHRQHCPQPHPAIRQPVGHIRGAHSSHRGDLIVSIAHKVHHRRHPVAVGKRVEHMRHLLSAHHTLYLTLTSRCKIDAIYIGVIALYVIIDTSGQPGILTVIDGVHEPYDASPQLGIILSY